jgi:hypothetical protein
MGNVGPSSFQWNPVAQDVVQRPSPFVTRRSKTQTRSKWFRNDTDYPGDSLS